MITIIDADPAPTPDAPVADDTDELVADAEGEDTTPSEDTVAAGEGEDTVDAGAEDTQSFTGTDSAETLPAPGPDQALNADLQGGDDSATGDAQNDTIAGGTGADTLSGAAGDDLILSTSIDPGAASDTDVDSLEGGLGDDTLVLGVGDIASGGAGADIYALRSDVNDTVTVTDFDDAEDLLVIEAENTDDVTVLGQTATAQGIVVSLSSGAAVLLAGVTDPINPAHILIEVPGSSTTA